MFRNSIARDFDWPGARLAERVIVIGKIVGSSATATAGFERAPSLIGDSRSYTARW